MKANIKKMISHLFYEDACNSCKKEMDEETKITLSLQSIPMAKCTCGTWAHGVPHYMPNMQIVKLKYYKKIIYKINKAISDLNHEHLEEIGYENIEPDITVGHVIEMLDEVARIGVVDKNSICECKREKLMDLFLNAAKGLTELRDFIVKLENEKTN